MSDEDLQPKTELEKILDEALIAVVEATRKVGGNQPLNDAVKGLSDKLAAITEHSHPDALARREAKRVMAAARDVLDRERRKPLPEGAPQTPLERLLARQGEAP